jgi:hypothetical protein
MRSNACLKRLELQLEAILSPFKACTLIEFH